MPNWLKDEKNKEIIESIKSILYALIIALTLRSSVIEANFIFSGSMTPTLLAGDYVLVNKMAYNFQIPFSTNIFGTPKVLFSFSSPERGDIITFIYPQDTSKIFVKRLIGLPGDKIEIKNQELYINDKKIEYNVLSDFEGSYSAYKEFIQNHTHSVIHYKSQSIYVDFGPVNVPENSFFVLGDNRDNSQDSRFWGFVPKENILGKTLIIYFSNSETLWPSFKVIDWIKNIRWNRFGSILINA